MALACQLHEFRSNTNNSLKIRFVLLKTLFYIELNTWVTRHKLQPAHITRGEHRGVQLVPARTVMVMVMVMVMVIVMAFLRVRG
jgi:hypothetical protein